MAIRPGASQLLTDMTFLCGTQWAADGAASAQHPPYVYRFNYRPACMAPFDLTLPGVYHTIELPFVFQTPLASDCIYLPAESKFALEIGALWTEFAKTGKLENWPVWASNDRVRARPRFFARSSGAWCMLKVWYRCCLLSSSLYCA
jgi:carboxylesterase type B